MHRTVLFSEVASPLNIWDVAAIKNSVEVAQYKRRALSLPDRTFLQIFSLVRYDITHKDTDLSEAHLTYLQTLLDVSIEKRNYDNNSLFTMYILLSYVLFKHNIISIQISQISFV